MLTVAFIMSIGSCVRASNLFIKSDGLPEMLATLTLLVGGLVATVAIFGVL